MERTPLILSSLTQWDEALLTMSKGETAQVEIESEWAYGRKGLPDNKYPLLLGWNGKYNTARTHTRTKPHATTATKHARTHSHALTRTHTHTRTHKHTERDTHTHTHTHTSN